MRKINPKQLHVNHWTLFEYSYAMNWWRQESSGIGHFNQSLYENILEAKENININKNQINQK